MNQKQNTKTSEEWQALDKYNIVTILDPDGWRDGTCDFYTDLITEEEFCRRKMMCTCNFLAKRKENGKQHNK